MKSLLIKNVVEKILSYNYGTNKKTLKKIIMNKVTFAYNKKSILEFIIPAFPGKSPNPKSSFSILPDNTEFLAVNTIEKFIDDINTIYPFGCKVNIIHDGHFFIKLNITRSEKELNDYIDFFRNNISQNINSITIYDLMGSSDFECAYQKFIDDYYSISNFECDSNILSKEILFTKFEFKNNLCDINTSKNQIQLRAKAVAKESLKIKAALSKLIDDNFYNCIRLSVHFQTSKSNKMGLKLIPKAINKGTPWFYVVYKSPNGNIILGKKDWKIPEKKQKRNKYGLYYSINNATIDLFLKNQLDARIKEERKYNR